MKSFNLILVFLSIFNVSFSQTGKIDVNAWERGLYLIKLYNEEGNFKVLRILKN